MRSEIDTLKISNEMIVLEDTIETKTQLLQHRKALINQFTLQGSLNSDSASMIKAEYDAELEKLQNENS